MPGQVSLDDTVLFQLSLSECCLLHLRWLALIEIHLYVAMAVQMFDMKLLDPLPDAVRPSPHKYMHTLPRSQSLFPLALLFSLFSSSFPPLPPPFFFLTVFSHRVHHIWQEFPSPAKDVAYPILKDYQLEKFVYLKLALGLGFNKYQCCYFELLKYFLHCIYIVFQNVTSGSVV